MRNLAHFLVYLLGKGKGDWRKAYLSPLHDRCLVCDQEIARTDLYQQYRVCPFCRFHYSLTARGRIELLADKGSFKEMYRSIVSLDPLSFSTRTSYRKRLSQDQKRTGLTEAAVVGRCSLGKAKAILVVLDFGFLGGSMGSVVGEKVALAFERAAKKSLPLVAVVSGGGVRIQEGILSLMQMAKTVTAATRLHRKGLPFIVVLTNPTTGQAYASFANLADVILAEPGSLMGLVPIRTLQEASQKPVPDDALTAEAHLQHGLLDQVVDREALKGTLSTLLALLTSETSINSRKTRKLLKQAPLEMSEAREPAEAWATIETARHDERPTTTTYIQRVFSDFVELRGDRVQGEDLSLVGGIGSLNGQSVVVIGHERRQAPRQPIASVYPEGFRKAQRLMRLAAKFDLPLITFINTTGAYLGLDAEEKGVANAVATTLALMVELPTPIISVIIGEGGSEGALALGVADRILMQENAIYCPIAPERVAARLYRDPSKARHLAGALRVTARDCLELEIVDAIVPEPEGGAHTDIDRAAQYLQLALLREIPELLKLSPKKLIKQRYKKFRQMGEHSSYFREAIKQEISQLEQLVFPRKQKAAAAPEPTDGMPESATEGEVQAR